MVVTGALSLPLTPRAGAPRGTWVRVGQNYCGREQLRDRGDDMSAEVVG